VVDMRDDTKIPDVLHVTAKVTRIQLF